MVCRSASPTNNLPLAPLQSDYNQQQSHRLISLARAEMQRQAVREQLEEVDQQVMEWLARFTVSHKVTLACVSNATPSIELSPEETQRTNQSQGEGSCSACTRGESSSFRSIVIFFVSNKNSFIIHIQQQRQFQSEQSHQSLLLVSSLRGGN